MNQNSLKQILATYRTVAIVGLSRNPSKESYKVAEYLKKNSFHIVPVNPLADEVLSERSHKSLLDIPADVQKIIEVVDIFRPAEDVPQIVEQTIQLKELHGVPHVVWMQLGIVNEQAAKKARKAGLTVVMDKCMMREHRRLFGNLQKSV